MRGPRLAVELPLNKVWSITDEINLAGHCKAKYRKNYISLYDMIIPKEYQFKLWEALGKYDKMELHCSYFLSFFLINSIIDDIAKFIKKCLKYNP